MSPSALRGLGRFTRAPAAAAAAEDVTPSASNATAAAPEQAPAEADASASTPTSLVSTPNETGPSPSSAAAATNAAASSAAAVAANASSALSPSSSAASVSEKPSKPGLFSRLNIQLPYRSRNRNVADFHINPDHPYKQYQAGDSIRGSVVLVLVKPLRITHLVVNLHGYVNVYKDPTASRSQSGATPRGGISTLPQYHGNGVASLFSDEQVLSGEGRLEPGRYEFGFDLLFPNKPMPSSVDFERGSISYVVTATLTRPTAIAPTSTCERRVMFVQQIDVGEIPTPRPRTIFLEPISKRTRKKRPNVERRTSNLNQETRPANGGSDAASRDSAADDSNRENGVERSGNDGRSEFSGESARSTSTGISRSEFSVLSQMASVSKQQVVDNKTITATIELLKGGQLPGDPVTIRVTVQHIKRLKSMTGIIVTLYRQGKIDSAPSATLFIGNGDKAVDEAYPRSRAGIGGLSISSAGSKSMFRKDLDQNTAPLIIDPVTLHASVTVTLKLPDECFPTIKGVPGGMISFKYQAEVIVDLGGRLSSQITHGTQSAASSRFGPYGVSSTDQPMLAYGSRVTTSIMDTTPLRRQKGVISVSMELIVGTTDSSRTRKLAQAQRKRTIRIADEEEPDYFNPGNNMQIGSNSQPASPVPPTPNSRPPYAPPTQPMPSQGRSMTFPQQNNHVRDAAPAYIPRPQVASDANISEKERIRQAETRLLPSQPSALAGPSGSGPGSGSAPVPSAPVADDDIYGDDTAPRAPPEAGPSAPPESEAEAGPSAPPLEHVTSSTHPTEDKQELERRRLIDEASAPPEVPDDVDHEPAVPTMAEASGSPEEPSAPVLNEEDEFERFGVETAGPSAPAAEQLPAYQR